ncbi:hypothetical protein J2802_007221 [Paraburkholderia caribensis]|nr:hypothetical protein [Paraburkholderia caribensis]
MGDINGIHVMRAGIGTCDGANKTRLSPLFYLTDLTAHNGEPGLLSA